MFDPSWGRNDLFCSNVVKRLVSLSKENAVLEILKQETQTRCADNFITVAHVADDYEMKLWG